LRVSLATATPCDNNKYYPAARKAAPNEPGVGNAFPCRSEHARDGCPDIAGIQTASVIVGDLREHARSYRRSSVAPGFAINY
jgi:hypothetical protein